MSVEKTPPLFEAPKNMESAGFIDGLKNRWNAALGAAIIGTAALVAPVINEQPAYADSSEVVIGMPFDGRWAYSNPTSAACGSGSGQTSHPSCHETYFGDWAVDLYAPAGTDVKLKASSDKNLTFSWDTSASGSCGETRRINVLANGTQVGKVHFTHLSSAASTASAPTNDMVVGKIANLSCNPGGTYGKHVHTEFDNTTNKSCYFNHSTITNTAGVSVNAGSPIGKLGSPNTNAKEVCTQAPSDPSAPPDPLSLSFVRLNAPGGAQVVSYSESSNFTAMTENATSGYPSTTPDGMVVPLFQPDGDLSFVRLNHGSGQVEVVTYGEASGYKTMTEHEYTGYPGVPNDGAVVPQYWLNGDLVMLRLNHPSHNMELASYSHSSGYHSLVNYALLGYPSVPIDGSVVPLIQPNDGDLSFVNTNRAPANTEDITYSVGSNFQTMNNYSVTGYPSISPAEHAVWVRYSQ